MNDLQLSIEQTYFHNVDVLSMRYVGSYLDCGLAFEDLNKFIEQRRITNSRCLGLCYDDPDKFANCRYDACFEVHRESFGKILDFLKGTLSSIRLDTIEGFECIKTTYKGSYKKLYDVYGYLYSLKNYEFNFQKPNVEIYLNNPSEAIENDLLTEIYIPIIKNYVY